METLEYLATIKAPTSVKLALLLSEIQSGEAKDEDVYLEVKNLAKAMKTILLKNSSVAAKDKKIFHHKYQAFLTSNLSARDFSLFIKKLASKYKLKVKMSQALRGEAKTQKRLRDIKGTDVFEALEGYIRDVENSLIVNQNQRELRDQASLYRLLVRFFSFRADTKRLE